MATIGVIDINPTRECTRWINPRCGKYSRGYSARDACACAWGRSGEKEKKKKKEGNESHAFYRTERQVD